MSIIGSLAKVAKKVADVGKNLIGLVGTGPNSHVPKGQANTPIDADGLHKATEVLGLIYRSMVRAREDEITQMEIEKSFVEKQAEDEDNRNDELIKALTLKRKVKKKKPTPKKEPKKKEEKKPTVKESEGSKSAPKKAETPPKKEAPTAKKEEVPEAPKPTAKKEEVPEAPKPTAQKAPSRAPSLPSAALPSGAAPVVAALSAAGLSQKAQANVLAQVKSESNFVPKSENLNYSSPERIQTVFGKGRFPTVESAKPYVKNPEALANYVYAHTDGNSELGDGWKYRGRGFLQHTGKAQYESIKKYTGIDVVSNPDLLNSPDVAAKAVPWFFLQYKGKKPEQLDSISAVNKSVGFAGGKEEAAKREVIASQYESQTGATSLPTSSTTGSQIDQSSKENKDLKASSTKKSVNVNTTNVVSGGSSSGTQVTSNDQDDRSPYDKKK
jgi:putative chitinase